MSDGTETTLEVRQTGLANAAATFELGQRIFTADRWPPPYRSVGFGQEQPRVDVTRNLAHYPEYVRRRGEVA